MRHLIPIVCLILPSTGLADSLPDPTRPADYVPGIAVESAAPEQTEWTVNGITISPRGNSAIVNGQVVSAGDEVAAAIVLEILPTAVVFNFEGRELTVEFLPQIVKSLTSKKPIEGSIEWGGL